MQLPSVSDVLALPAVAQGEPVVRGGRDRLEQTVRWVHVAEVSWIASLLEGGELILTTGVALPRAQRDLRRWIQELAGVGACGVVVELGRRFRTLPPGLVEAAVEADLPLIELHRETPFVAVTQAVHTLILDARMQELVASDERQTHRTLLTALALSTDSAADTAGRSAALSVPLAGRQLTAVAVRTVDGTTDAALLRDLANRAADTLRAHKVAALVGPIDDHRVVVLLSQERPGRPDAVVTRLADQLHAIAEQRRAPALVIAVSSTLAGPDGASATVREALRVADTAAALAPHRGWFRSSDLRLQGLVYALRESDHLREYVERELGALLAHDAEHRSQLTAFLSAYCRAGGNKTAAAAELFISRAALYDRIAKVERILDIDLTDPQVVLALHFALLAHEAVDRPGLAVRPG